MEKLLPKPDSGHLLGPHVDFHAETISWLSDLDFCQTELSFFLKLISKTFMWSITNPQRLKLTSLEKRVEFLLKNLNKVHVAVVKHEKNLSALDEDQLVSTHKTIELEHSKSATLTRNLQIELRNLKKEIFQFVENHLIAHSESAS